MATPSAPASIDRLVTFSPLPQLRSNPLLGFKRPLQPQCHIKDDAVVIASQVRSERRRRGRILREPPVGPGDSARAGEDRLVGKPKGVLEPSEKPDARPIVEGGSEADRLKRIGAGPWIRRAHRKLR